MDYASIHVILLDERIQQDRFECGTSNLLSEPKELLDDVQCLLSVFKGGGYLLLFGITRYPPDFYLRSGADDHSSLAGHWLCMPCQNEGS